MERVLDGGLGDWIPGIRGLRVCTSTTKAWDQDLEPAKAWACSKRRGWVCPGAENGWAPLPHPTRLPLWSREPLLLCLIHPREESASHCVDGVTL